MIETNSISISKPVEYVFDMVTDPTRAHEWSEFTRSVEILSRGEWGGYDQARWIMIKGKLEVESIETVLKYERPTLFASKSHMTRYRRVYFESSKEGLPPVGEIDHPKDFIDERTFENDKVSVLEQQEFIPTGQNSMTLIITTDSQLGPIPLVMALFGKLFRRPPHMKMLTAIKTAAEKETEGSGV